VPRKRKPDFEREAPLIVRGKKTPVVYCVQSGATNRYKVGKTDTLISRLRTLQTGNPDPLSVQGLIVHRTLKGAAKHEASLHRRYASTRGIGEWFVLKGPAFTGIDFCDSWKRCAWCERSQKDDRLALQGHAERLKALIAPRRRWQGDKTRRRRLLIMRRINQESFEDQLVLREIRVNRRKANRQHQWVRRKRVASHRGSTGPWDEDNEVNPKIDLKKFLKK
jgi:T5orf172 domain